MRTITRISYGGRRRILAVMRSRLNGPWCLCWANPSPHGHTFDAVLEGGFKTQRLALERKRTLLLFNLQGGDVLRQRTLSDLERVREHLTAAGRVARQRLTDGVLVTASAWRRDQGLRARLARAVDELEEFDAAILKHHAVGKRDR